MKRLLLPLLTGTLLALSTTPASAQSTPDPMLVALVPVAAVPGTPVATPSYIYTASTSPSVLTVVNAHAHHVATTLPIPPGSFATGISPAFSTIYVAAPSTVTSISSASNRVTATIHLPGVTQLAALSNGSAAVLYASGTALGVINQAGTLVYHRTLKVPATYLAAGPSIYSLSFNAPKKPIVSSYSLSLNPLAATNTPRGSSGLAATPLGVFVPDAASASLSEFTLALKATVTIQVTDPQLISTNANNVFVATPTKLYEYSSSSLVASTPLKAPLISMIFVGQRLYTTSFAPQSAFSTYNLPGLTSTSTLTLALATGTAVLVPGANLAYVSNHAGLLADVALN